MQREMLEMVAVVALFSGTNAGGSIFYFPGSCEPALNHVTLLTFFSTLPSCMRKKRACSCL
jgi:hypothetical protein